MNFNMKRYQFTDEEKEDVKEAVEALERESCGEIVPFFTRRSDDYDEVSWHMSALMGVIGLSLISLLSYTWALPSISYIEAFAIVFALMVIGYFLPLVFPQLKMLLVSQDRKLEMVALRAKEAFLNEKVYATEEHVGILIYVSRLEHLVLVLGDEGINEKVNPEDWQQVVSLISSGLKCGKVGAGFVDGINQCKELLLSHGFLRKATDTNELSNELRLDE